MPLASRLMHLYRELVSDPAWRLEQERREAEKLERFAGRLFAPTPLGGADGGFFCKGDSDSRNSVLVQSRR